MKLKIAFLIMASGCTFGGSGATEVQTCAEPSDCDSGKTCDLISQKCVLKTASSNQLEAKFRCTRASGNIEREGTLVTSNFDGLGLDFAAACLLREFGASIEISLVGGTNPRAITLDLPKVIASGDRLSVPKDARVYFETVDESFKGRFASISRPRWRAMQIAALRRLGVARSGRGSSAFRRLRRDRPAAVSTATRSDRV